MHLIYRWNDYSKNQEDAISVNLSTGGYSVENKWLFISENSENSPDPNDTVNLDEWESEGGRIVEITK